MPETQPRVGTLREESTNDTKKTGRPLSNETQTKVGHLREVNANDKDKGGSEPPALDKRGYRDASGDPQPPEPRRIDDKVKPAEGGSY
jgi:hypothetical protein